MPIITLQQQQARVGKIRIGHQVPTGNGNRTRPEKLDRFRFTSQTKALVEAAAAAYGGEVTEWTNDGHQEWQVTSQARVLPVLVPPRPVTQWFELWSGAGCQRRCDGETDTISGDACKCPLDPMDRAEAAGKGQACKATTRLKVMLPELPGLGVWEIVSHGYYAALELPQTAEFLGAVTDQGGYIRATLAIEARTVKRPGQGIRSFYVPALHVEMTPEQLMAGAGTALVGSAARALEAGKAAGPVPEQAAITAGPDPMVERAQSFVARVEAAQSAEDIRALWTEAGPELLTLVIDAGDGRRDQLGLFMRARGETFAALPGDVDAVWLECVRAAADLPEGAIADIEAEFATWSQGKSAAEATVEDARGFLTFLTGLRDGVTV